ncbi:hypothetical protein [Serratia fonticola]|uniref:hypothetical protein n=1 Tax=Serratia fonticola TaxID=47917 RepID=UPI002179E24D|nr:hypothetical protein [Serratia fonticola]CAI2003489.1 Uncharacterised protein [Serratia fonticola]
MSVEINNLIKERRIGLDDGCDHCSAIIDGWNASARARSRSPYQRPVKPVPVTTPQVGAGAIVKIGNRNMYGRKVLTGIYQLHLSGRTPGQIAIMLKMPFYRVEHLLKRNTPMRREIFLIVSTAPLPTEAEILRRLAAESKA